ncbi:MAG TPA: TonB family protein [Rhodanobacteraceae bacterium]|nr:TonB family protein [Rhodanobacteraceae bacterium]
MSAQQLLDEARNAVRAQRWVSPAGNNAFEFYLQVLQKDPGNQVARNALRESFTTGANAAEQSINAGNFDEAEREIGLLAQADSGNYTLTILRSKLDAQRKLDARAEEQQKQQEAAEARKAAAAALAAAAPQPEEKEKPAPTPVQSAEQVAKAPPPAAPEPAPEPKVVKPVGPTRGALLVKSAQAVPPRMAVRRHRSGWVDVVFTVDAQGNVVDAHVSDSQPSHVFDRAAIAAVERYKFKPALKDGVPIATKAKQRINFNL